MTKVVINRCFGGFSLSDKAVRYYAKVKGIELYPSKDKRFWGTEFYLCPEEKYQTLSKEDQSKMYFTEYKIERTDPALITVVETLGEEANGRCAELKVVEIPDGIEWTIEEYDGVEWVAEKHRTWR